MGLPPIDDEPVTKKKESHFKKWLNLVFSWKFLIELSLLAIHPFPYFERDYTVDILDMMISKS